MLARIANIVRSIITWIVSGIMVILFGNIIFPLLVFIFRFNEEKLYFAAAKSWSRILIALSGSKVRVNGLENLPNTRPILIVANHTSYADAPLFLKILPFRFRFVIIEITFHFPFFGFFVKKMGCVPVHDNAEKTFLTMLKLISMIKRGDSIMIFPEGDVPRDDRLQDFNPGIALLALYTGVPVVPIAVKGPQRVLPYRSWIMNAGKIEINIGRPLKFGQAEQITSELLQEVTGKIKIEIESLLSEI